MDLLLIFDENKSHYVHIRDFNKLMLNKIKNKNKKYFCSTFVLVINGKQSVKLRKGLISFKNHSKQIPADFKVYADPECIFRPN